MDCWRKKTNKKPTTNPQLFYRPIYCWDFSYHQRKPNNLKADLIFCCKTEIQYSFVERSIEVCDHFVKLFFTLWKLRHLSRQILPKPGLIYFNRLGKMQCYFLISSHNQGSYGKFVQVSLWILVNHCNDYNNQVESQ